MKKLPSLACSALAVFALLALPKSSANAQTDWPLPVPPAGTNSAVFPAPNNPWMTKFLANKERAAKGGVDLLFIGDSISEGWKNTGAAVFESSFPKGRSATFGISGDRTENILWRLRHGEMDGIAPKVIVVLAGTNNVNRNTTEEIAKGIAAIVDECHRISPESQIVLLNIFPRSATADAPWRKKLAEVNLLLPPLGERPYVTLLDIGETFLLPDGAMNRSLMPDLLHPNRAGYEAWAAALKPTLAQYLD